MVSEKVPPIFEGKTVGLGSETTTEKIIVFKLQKFKGSLNAKVVSFCLSTKSNI